MSAGDDTLIERFEALLALPPDQRAAALAVLDIDAGMRDELAALLAADACSDTRLDRAIAGGAQRLCGLSSGLRLGPWEVISEIGAGGMGTVFLGVRADGAFAQQVAIKVLRGFPTEDGMRRLRQERRILAELDHPNIARLLDGGETPEGQPYLVMEYVEGLALADWLAQAPAAAAPRLALFDKLASAVAHAHRQLVVHRDLKPGNVIVRADGEPKLLDFGVARLAALEASEGSTRVASAGWASPEQSAGGAVTTASDVYSLGVILRVLLGGGDDRAADAPMPLADAELRGVVAMATARDPARRYPGADALREDLLAWRERRPLRALPDTAHYRVAKFITRHRVGAAVALAAVVGVAVFTTQLATERDRARAAAVRAEAVSGFLVRLFRDIDPAANRVAADAARSHVQGGEAALVESLAATPDVRAAVLSTLAEVNQSLGDFAAAERLARASLAADADAAQPMVALRRAQLAQALSSRGDYDAALAVVDAALAAVAGHDDAGDARARLLAAQANAAQLKGDHALALASAAALLDGPDAAQVAPETRAMAQLTRAYVAEQRGDFVAALAAADAAAAPLALAVGPSHPRVFALDAYRAFLQIGLDRLADAERAANAAVAGLERVYGGSHARLAYALTIQALAQQTIGRTADARATGERALAMCRLHLSAEHAQCAVSAQVLAQIADEQGDDATALPLLRDVLRVRRSTLRADHPYVGHAELLLAEALCKAGDSDGARTHAAQAEAVLNGLPLSDADVQRLAELRRRCG